MPSIPAEPFDRAEVDPLIERIRSTHAELENGSASAADGLRAALQGLALCNGFPAELGGPAMAAARVLRDLPEDDDERTAALRSVDEAVACLLDALETSSNAADGEPEADATSESEPPSAEHAAPTDHDGASAEEPAPETSEAPAQASEGPRLMRGSSDPLIGEFLTESLEHLESAEEQLLVLEDSPGDADALNSVFRSFHTVKGGAGILDLPELSKFAHSAESVLDLAREGGITLQGHPIDLCYQAVDILKGILEGLASGEESFELPSGYDTALEQLDSIASAGDTIPTAASAPEAAEPTEANDAPTPAPKAAAPADDAPADAVTPAPKPQAAAPKRSAAEESKGGGATKKKLGAGSVKIATDRLDNMINLVGELVITTAMVQQEVSQADRETAPRSLSQLGKVTTELQHIAMSMRMVPLKATFQKAARLVRDVAAQCGKKVHFESGGEDTELDRNVVERLGDPLIHMLRNAVDHGVEDPESRAAAGKSETGKIRLEAYHESGSVVIVLSDDGAGMNRERILAKAVKNGLLTEQQAEEMPDSEVWHLIFHPGLSTAEKVSSVSGRGVGMDVVRKNIEALRGSIEIESELGKGSRVLIRLPLTLAIIDAMVVVVGNRPYILPTLTIQSFLRPNAENIFRVQDQGEVLSVRERILPIYRLSELLGVRNAIDDPTEGLLAITSADGHHFALLVDDLRGQQQVVIKSMGSGDRKCPGVSGAAILGDGTVGLILDPVGLSRLAQKGKAPRRPRELQRTPA